MLIFSGVFDIFYFFPCRHPVVPPEVTGVWSVCWGGSQIRKLTLDVMGLDFITQQWNLETANISGLFVLCKIFLKRSLKFSRTSGKRNIYSIRAWEPPPSPIGYYQWNTPPPQGAYMENPRSIQMEIWSFHRKLTCPLKINGWKMYFLI